MNILNIQLKLAKNLSGFTFVELLVGISMFAVIGTVTLSILFATLRASKKSDVLVSLRQDGNTVMSQVGRNIRYARSLDAPASCISPVNSSSITITSNSDGGQTTFACVSGASSTVASNGASLTDTDSTVMSNCEFVCTQPTLNDPPTITFSFVLSAKSSSGLSESNGSIPFQSSITLRNYQ